MSRYLLGIDIGTSSTKALIVGEDGKNYGLGQVKYDIQTPKPSWSEQDPELWWKSVVIAIKEASLKTDLSGGIINAIGLSGQMHGMVLLDEAGKVLRPSIIWADQRTKEEVQDYYKIIGKENLAKMTANRVAVGFLGPSLLWVKKHEPELYKQIRWVLLPKDYIRYRLTGVVATESTDASGTLLFDTANRMWSYEMISKLGLETDYLPPCFEPWELAGYLTEKAAAEIGLPALTTVALGGADQPMQAIGNGIVNPGVVSITIGTGGRCLRLAVKHVMIQI